MITGIFQGAGMAMILAAFGAALLWGWRSPADALLAGGNLVIGLGDLAGRQWGWAAFAFAAAAWCGWDWWRRQRKRSPRTLGAKSWALLAALVKAMRESLRPRPVLRPLPEGAR